VNHTVLKGLRNDVEIYRCRATIIAAPTYRLYLEKVNALKDKYMDLLVAGAYKDTEGITWDNGEIDARSFVAGDRMALVLAQSHLPDATTTVQVPGYTFVEHGGVGDVAVRAEGQNLSVKLGKHGLAVLLYQKAK
jgi:hypothetical protein